MGENNSAVSSRLNLREEGETERLGRAQDFDLARNDAVIDESEFFSGADRDVDDTSLDERSSVGDADNF